MNISLAQISSIVAIAAALGGGVSYVITNQIATYKYEAEMAIQENKYASDLALEREKLDDKMDVLINQHEKELRDLNKKMEDLTIEVKGINDKYLLHIKSHITSKPKDEG